MKTITFSTQKGGAGKTTCSLGLIHKLEKTGRRTLAIDLDSQGNLTKALDVPNATGGALAVLSGEKGIRDAIVRKSEHVDVLPYSIRLSVADKTLDEIGKEHKLKEALDEIRGDYEYCVIDTPPALGIVVVNAYTASEYVVMPIKGDDYFSLDSIPAVVSTINSVRKYWNPDLKLLGFVINEYNPRSVFARQLLEAVENSAATLNTVVFDSKVSKGIAIAENKATRENIFGEKSRNKAVASLDELTDEIIRAV